MSTPPSRYAFLSRGWWEDGYPHQRDDTGFCGSCGARRGEAHYRLKPRTPSPAPSELTT